MALTPCVVLGMIIAELLEKRGIAARGLAHPIVFQGGNGFGGGAGPTGPRGRINKRNKDGPVDPPPGDFQTFGAVMVTPKNFYRLMATGQAGLLFPGGVREVFHGKGEEYELFWPEKVDFVRVASRFNATIIPISAVGSADSANILLDPDELLNLPFGLGDRLRNSSESTISARFDQSNSDERFVPPVSLNGYISAVSQLCLGVADIPFFALPAGRPQCTSKALLRFWEAFRYDNG